MQQATPAPLTTIPYHEHDCTKCRYLGSMMVDGKGPADWYVHDSTTQGDTGTIICRFSSEGRDYWSQMTGTVRDGRYGHASHHDDTHVTRIVVSSMLILARYMLALQQDVPMNRPEDKSGWPGAAKLQARIPAIEATDEDRAKYEATLKKGKE